MNKFLFLLSTTVLLPGACTQKGPTIVQQVSRETAILQNLDSLKRSVMPGDLVVRLGDDLLSYQIKYLNEKDQSWSHAGVVMEQDGVKRIVHISPDDGQDGIQLTPIDSFLAPQKNLSCALYRYDFSPAERDSFTAVINQYKHKNLRFDRLYNLATDDEMYCSEMISKAIAQATQNRIKFKDVLIPAQMQPALYRYFKQQLSKQTIAERKIMTIDNLYRIPQCRLVMQFPLKFFPGQ